MERAWMRMDLNLLKALHVLLEERSVSRAAERFHVTRSAMSKTLSRLRQALHDPLLVPTADGLAPTPRAEEIGGILAETLLQLEQGLRPRHFDPEQATGELVIAAPESFAVGAVPGLLRAVSQAAPRLKVSAVHLEDHFPDQLDDGSIDFALYIDQDYPEAFIKHRLYSARPVIWCRKDHPLTRLPEVCVEDIVAYPRVAFRLPSIRLPGLLALQEQMERLQIGRGGIIETSHLTVGLVLLCESDALMFSLDRLFRHPVFHDAVVSLPLSHFPMFEEFRIDYCLVQHERTARSPLHQWIVAELIRACEG